MASPELVLAALGVLVATWAAWQSRHASRTASEALIHARDVDLRDLADRRRRDALAVDIYWGHDRESPGKPDSFALVINNRSDAALTALRVNVRVDNVSRQFTSERIPPGWWRARNKANNPQKQLGWGYVKPADPARFSLAETPGYKVVDYQFADSAGRRWSWTEEQGLTADNEDECVALDLLTTLCTANHRLSEDLHLGENFHWLGREIQGPIHNGDLRVDHLPHLGLLPRA